MCSDGETTVEYELERQSYKDLPQYLCAWGIHKTVLEGDFESLKLRIESGEYVNKRLPPNKFSILHLAVIKNNTDILDFLLVKEGVEVDARSSEDKTPLYLATALGYTESVEKLIRAGADVNICTPRQNPVLHISVQRPDICHLLIRHGARIDAVDSWGWTLLHEAVFRECLEVVHMLLYYNVDVNVPDVFGCTPFMKALELRKPGVQEALLEYVDDFDRANCNTMLFGSTLSFALLGNSPFIKDIIERGADVNYGNDPEVSYSDGAFLACLRNPVDLSAFKLVWERLRPNGTDSVNLVHFLDIVEVELAFLQVIIDSDNFQLAVDCLSRRRNYSLFVYQFAERKFKLEQLTALTCRLLQYGFRATSHNIHTVFSNYGYCELFRILLYMDNDFTLGWLPHAALTRLMFDIDFNLESVANRVSDIPAKDVVRLLEYSICPRLIDALTLKYSNDKGMSVFLGGLPRVPSLVELARNAARKHIWQAFKISNNCQFYTTIDHLDVSTLCKHILTFRKRICRVQSPLLMRNVV
ncbi:uncharacterized protein LOC108909214 [Anoplophora glabripennis]|uniref:uncharacterized protein LOC108909214 n=1 Tax=Anoplophora glabripennis TaxID=217634 RepID=UPI0008759431|nr:uncharacterized protein LOC108909214 [Anoplophora glabripennis]